MYDPLKDKKPYGACVKGEDIYLEFPLDIKDIVKNIYLILRKDNREERKLLKFKEVRDGEAIYSIKFQVQESGIWHYRFEGELLTGGIAYYGRDYDGRAIRKDWMPEWQLTVCDKAYKTPEWAKSGVCYQIFADRFNKGEERNFTKQGTLHKRLDEQIEIAEEGKDYRANDYYGGNIKGIIEKLEYLKELNVSCIYLTPIFEAHSNHRYDTADYLKIDSLFGTEEQLQELIDEAHKRNIKIMLDGVFNHTGSDSIYFNKNNRYPEKGAYQSKESKYYDWYYFYEYPDEYHSWWGCTVVPTVNKEAKGYKDLILGKNGVIEKWTSKGIDAWRLDVVDELPISFTTELCKKIHSCRKDELIIGEVWEDATTKVSYDQWRPYFMGDQLDSVMNYPFKEAIIEFCKTKDKDIFIGKVTTILEHYPKESLDTMLNLLGSHDTTRVLTALSDRIPPESKSARRVDRLSPHEYIQARERLKLAILLQYTLPGIPMVYYGDERGMEGYEDPLNRLPIIWDNIDSVIFRRYKKMGELRQKYKDVLKGETTFIQHETLLIYKRSTEEEELTIIINPTGSEQLFEGVAIGPNAYEVLFKRRSNPIKKQQEIK